MIRVLGLAIVFTTLALPALAQTPPFLPGRDVSVSYELAAPGRATQDYQLSYNAARELARVDSAQGIYVLANLPSGQAQVVIPALHAYVEAPDLSNLTQMISTAGGAHFTPLGPGNFAGLPCEKYLVLNAQGTGTTCITSDGVVLHFSGHDSHGSAEVTALSVTYTPQPADNFGTPDGFSQITLPPGALAALLAGQ
jgi:hypothetical protein